MLENKINPQSAITTLPYLDWNATYSATLDAVAELESGKVLYFPHLAFNLTDAEKPYSLQSWSIPNARILAISLNSKS